MMALLRLLSQKRPWVRGKMAMHSKRRQKNEMVQNGRMLPKVSIKAIVLFYLSFTELFQELQHSLIPSFGANPLG